MFRSPALTYLEENHERFQNELIELVRIPSISHDPAYKAEMDEISSSVGTRTERLSHRAFDELPARQGSFTSCT